MLLRVDFADFPETARREVGHSTAYVRNTPRGSLITASNGTNVVASISSLDFDAARSVLETAEMIVHRGGWALDAQDWEPEDSGADAYVAAIAYKSPEDTPGLWVDAFPFMPTPAQALRAMYDEFIGNGEMRETPFDEFVRVAQANVVILTPGQLGAYASGKTDPCDP